MDCQISEVERIVVYESPHVGMVEIEIVSDSRSYWIQAIGKGPGPIVIEQEEGGLEGPESPEQARP